MTPEQKTPGVCKAPIGLADEPRGSTKRIDRGEQVLGNKRIAEDLKKYDWKSYRSIVPRVGVQGITQTGKVAND